MFTSPTRRTRLVALVVATAAVAALAGCSSTTKSASNVDNTKSAAPMTATVTVMNARVNAPVLKTQTAAFATLMNKTNKDVTLMTVSVPAADAASAGLHKMAMVNGKMDMVPVTTGIVIKAGGTLMLKPGGFHMMLMMPTVKTGHMVPITFTFSDGTTVTASAMVQPVATASPSMKM